MSKTVYVKVPKELIARASTLVGAGGYSKDVIDSLLRELVRAAK